MTRTTLHSQIPNALALTLVQLLLACKPAEAPRGGVAHLSYLGTSQSAFAFKLENGTSEAITLRGWDENDDESSTNPEFYAITCVKKDVSQALSELPPISHHGPQAQSVELSPGSSMQLRIRVENLSALQESSCHLKLRLENGSMIRSAEFTL
jgi:hypothetical protein